MTEEELFDVWRVRAIRQEWLTIQDIAKNWNVELPKDMSQEELSLAPHQFATETLRRWFLPKLIEVYNAKFPKKPEREALRQMRHAFREAVRHIEVLEQSVEKEFHIGEQWERNAYYLLNETRFLETDYESKE